MRHTNTRALIRTSVIHATNTHTHTHTHTHTGEVSPDGVGCPVYHMREPGATSSCLWGAEHWKARHVPHHDGV